MESLRISSNSIFIMCITGVGIIFALQLTLGALGLQGGPPYAALVPLAASALLPLRQTLVVGFLNLTTEIVAYGFLIDRTTTGRILIIMAMVLSLCMSAAVCKVRIKREERVKSLMVARERLALLSEASTRVGRTLDVKHTARDLVSVAVPRFADFATVDLFDTVLQGGEPVPGKSSDEITLLRAAARSTGHRSAPEFSPVGTEKRYQQTSVAAQCMTTGKPIRADITEMSDAIAWQITEPGADWNKNAVNHSGIAVPVSARGTTLGVAVFIRHQRADPFDEDDLVFAEEITTRTAVCLDNARRYTREHMTSLTLQHSLLPQGLPENSAVEVATRYLPAGFGAGVGGDWYDVIPLSGARVALVVGDVVGHGLHASATMGRLRAAVRTLADIDLPPDELLTHLDDVVVRLRTEKSQPPEIEEGLGGGEIGATCLYAVYDPISRRGSFARAGHPRPALVLPDAARAEFLDIPAGPALGVGGHPFESADFELPEGSLLVLYTDGLIDSRRQNTGDGQERLRQVLSGPLDTLETTCDVVLETLLDDSPVDDVALLIARTQALDAGQVAIWDLLGDPEGVAKARELASCQLDDWGFADDVRFTMELVVSELVTNAIRYGAAPRQLRLIRDDTLICEVLDGSSTAPHLRRAHTFDEGGRGLFIVANLTERWGTRYTGNGKAIWAELAG